MCMATIFFSSFHLVVFSEYVHFEIRDIFFIHHLFWLVPVHLFVFVHFVFVCTVRIIHTQFVAIEIYDLAKLSYFTCTRCIRK